jgi:hypothetical protein
VGDVESVKHWEEDARTGKFPSKWGRVRQRPAARNTAHSHITVHVELQLTSQMALQFTMIRALILPSVLRPDPNVKCAASTRSLKTRA